MAQGSKTNMTINEEDVRAGIARIDGYLAEITTATTEFKEALDEANQKMHGNFSPTVAISQLIEEEKRNFAQVLEAQNDILVSFKKYNEKAEDTNDDSAFRLD